MKKIRQGLLPLTLIRVGFAPFSQAHSMQGPILSGADARELKCRGDIAQAWKPGHAGTHNSEAAAWRKFRQGGIRAITETLVCGLASND